MDFGDTKGATVCNSTKKYNLDYEQSKPEIELSKLTNYYKRAQRQADDDVPASGRLLVGCRR